MTGEKNVRGTLKFSEEFHQDTTNHIYYIDECSQGCTEGGGGGVPAMGTSYQGDGN